MTDDSTEVLGLWAGIQTNKSLPSKISLYGACMAVHNGFDNFLTSNFGGNIIYPK